MKRTKRIITLAMATILLIGATVAVTVAFLQSTTEVVQNTFTVGKVGITLDEALVTEYGKPATGYVDTNDTDQDKDTTEVIITGEVDSVEKALRVTENYYKLLPGHEYVKDPTVHVAAGSEESYIRMLVTISDLADVKAVLGTDETTGYFLPQNFVEGWEDEKWITTGIVVEDEEQNIATYEFRYYKTVNTLDGKVLDLEPLFTSIVVPENIENANLEKLKEMQVDIVAHAIQADGFVEDDNGTAQENAWAAFK